LRAAGHQLWKLAQTHHFVLFEHWMTDFLGHRRQFQDAIENFRRFDAFLGGLLEAVGTDLANTLIVIASDHGNVEDCSHGKHTENPALGLFLGGTSRERSRDAAQQSDTAEVSGTDALALDDLTHVTPFILRFLSPQIESVTH
jgi:2,3-bisphosphoglycerate-independent phosphoglycerate mutase